LPTPHAVAVGSSSTRRRVRWVIKRQVHDAMFQSRAAVQVADCEMFESFGSEDFREGIAHFVEKSTGVHGR
jgi:hypothetical protein